MPRPLSGFGSFMRELLQEIPELAEIIREREPEPGTHKHRCGIEPSHYAYPKGRGKVLRYEFVGGCGLVFEHGNDMAGNRESHVCTNCGRTNYCQYEGRVRPGRGILAVAPRGKVSNNKG